MDNKFSFSIIMEEIVGIDGKISLFTISRRGRILISDNINDYFFDKHNNRIVFLSFSEKGLYSVRPDGTDRHILYSGNVYYAILHIDQYIYYTPENKGISRIRSDGSDNEVICNFDNVGWIISIDKNVITYMEDFITKKINTNGDITNEYYMSVLLTELTGGGRLYKRLQQNEFFSDVCTYNNLIEIFTDISKKIHPYRDSCDCLLLVLESLLVCGIDKNEDISGILKCVYRYAPLYGGMFSKVYTIRLVRKLLEMENKNPDCAIKYIKYTTNDILKERHIERNDI